MEGNVRIEASVRLRQNGSQTLQIWRRKTQKLILSSYFLAGMSCKWGGSAGELAGQEHSTCFISLSCWLMLLSCALRTPVGLIPAPKFLILVFQTFLPGCVVSDCCFGQSANYTAWQPGWWQSLFFQKEESPGIIHYFLQFKFLVELIGQRKKTTKEFILPVSLIIDQNSLCLPCLIKHEKQMRIIDIWQINWRMQPKKKIILQALCIKN